jgi:hypothetical protein
MGFSNGQAHIGEPIDSYHLRPELSASMIKTLLDSPEKFHWQHVLNRPAVKPTDAMELGTVIHEDQLLAVWEQSWVEIPESALSGNGHRRGAAWEQFKRENKGKILLKSDQIEKIKWIREAVESNPFAAKLLDASSTNALNEITITADAPLSDGTTQAMRGRLDRLTDFVLDFKTISDLGERTIKYRPVDHRWDIQAVNYQLLVQSIRGGSLPDVYFIVVETAVPYRCEVICPCQQTLAAAALVLQDAIEEIIERTKSGNWHRTDWPAPLIF